jgi:hypothetical protein
MYNQCGTSISNARHGLADHGSRDLPNVLFNSEQQLDRSNDWVATLAGPPVAVSAMALGYLSCRTIRSRRCFFH